MESRITKKEKEKENKIKYPCLMVLSNREEEIVVLAYKDVGDGCFGGTLLLNNTNEPYHIGTYEEDWDINDFELFEGTLTLGN